MEEFKGGFPIRNDKAVFFSSAAFSRSHAINKIGVANLMQKKIVCESNWTMKLFLKSYWPNRGLKIVYLRLHRSSYATLLVCNAYWYLEYLKAV